MITCTDKKLPTYQIFGERLHINFDEKEVTVQNFDGHERIAYEYVTSVSTTHSDRSALINDIIRSQYNIADEFALINNAQEKPEQYAKYQAFRVQAKALADNWIAQLQGV